MSGVRARAGGPRSDVQGPGPMLVAVFLQPLVLNSNSTEKLSGVQDRCS